MSTTALLIIAIVLVAVVLGYFVMRKPSAPELPEEREPEKLPAAKSAKPKVEPAEGKAEAKKAHAKAAEVGAAPAKDEAARKEAKEAAESKGQRAAKAEAEPAEDEEEEAEPVEEHRPPPPPSLPRRERDVKGLRKGLAKVRESGGLFGRLRALFGEKKEIDPQLLQDMEEILLTSDVGVSTTGKLLSELKDALGRNELRDEERVWSALRERAISLLGAGGGLRDYGRPTVVLMVGVNGTGKTTTIGKLAKAYKKEGRKVMLVAADTFRAAAVEQLKIWGMRVGCEVFTAKSGTDPASVVFDAVRKAVDDKLDLVLVDTAGRLHTKANLMDELAKMVRTAEKALPGAPHEALLVVDATTGQNALQQAATFKEALPLTGIVLTKLDGTAKGGIVLAIRAEHDLPVRYIGVGERAEDLRDFDAGEFVEAMLGRSDEATEAA